VKVGMWDIRGGGRTPDHYLEESTTPSEGVDIEAYTIEGDDSQVPPAFRRKKELYIGETNHLHKKTRPNKGNAPKRGHLSWCQLDNKRYDASRERKAPHRGSKRLGDEGIINRA